LRRTDEERGAGHDVSTPPKLEDQPMNLGNTVWLVPALSLLIVACGPSPSKICAKLESLDASPPACEVKWEVSRSRDKEAYTKEAACVLAAKSKEDLQQCK
jgi:hypothetical protein